jgi:plasmid maintenance system antidote protein VapI
MENFEKQKVVNKLAAYCARFDSQNRAAKSLKGVSAATVSQMVNGKWELIKDEMWRNVAAQIGYTAEKWNIAETRDFKLLTQLLNYSKQKSKVSFITGAAGSGKTETIKHFAAENKRVHVVKCNDFWNRKTFLGELLTVMGLDSSGLTMYEMMSVIIRSIKQQDRPIIILDEADKLSDQLLYFFITLYNNLEDHCSIIMIATSFLQRRMERGIRLGKKGYPEIYSRGGRKFIELKGVGSADVRAVCIANGVTEPKAIKEIFEDSVNDLRRVKAKIEAYKEFVKPVNNLN